MPTTGNIFPGVGENNAGVGVTAWTNPGNATADDGADATCNAAASSQYHVSRDFGFGLPSTAEIIGITVRVEASEHSGGTEILNAQLQDGTGSLTGSSKSATLSGTAKTVYTYGGAADVWGATLTPAIVNDPDFGVRVWFTSGHDVRIDYVTLAIQYNDPVTIACGTGASVATGLQASVTLTAIVDCAAGAATASGAQATVSGLAGARIYWAAVYNTAVISATAGAASASGLVANTSGDVLISAALGSAAASGLQATVTATTVSGYVYWTVVNPSATIAAAIGAATASGLQASTSGDVTIPCAVGTATASGLAASIVSSTVTANLYWTAVYPTYTISGTVGSATASGLPFLFSDGAAIAAQLGSASAAGLAAAITSVDQQIAGSWTPAVLQRFWILSGAVDVRIDATVGAAAAAGPAASITGAQSIGATVGSATASGLPATATGAQVIDAAVGTATATAPAASISLTFIVNGSVGAAAAQGLTADVTGPQALQATVGSATASGLTAQIGAGQSIAAQTGSASASGFQALIVESIGCTTATAQALGLGFLVNESVHITLRPALARGLRAQVFDAFTVLSSTTVVKVPAQDRHMQVPVNDNRVQVRRTSL